MKSKNIIILTIISYIIFLVCIFFLGNIYVEYKDKKLNKEAYSNQNKFFNVQNEYIKVIYSGEKVDYESVHIPEMQCPLEANKSLGKGEQGNNDEGYRNIELMYKLKPMYRDEPNWTGWLFDIIQFNGNVIEENQIYPYMVGYKYQSDPYFNYFRPSVQSAIDTEFNFYTSNKKSSYIGLFNDTLSIHDIKRSIENEYYILFSYDDIVEYHGKKYADSLVNTAGSNFGLYTLVSAELKNSGVDIGGMYNGYFHTYDKKRPIKIWEIKYNIFTDPKKKDRNNIYLFGGIIATILLLIIIIPLSVKINKKAKMHKESLYDKLERKCNPAQFIKNYDKEKVDKANSLYKELLTIPKSERNKLLDLSVRISNELGITIIEPSALEDLKNKVNPNNFIKPYNPDKLELANKLYSQLHNNNLSYKEYSEIEEEYKKLV